MRRRAAVRALRGALETLDPGADRIRARTQEIGRELIAASAHMREPNFDGIHPDDLARLFAAYDARFLGGLCGRAAGRGRLTFRLSPRMTRAGGKTTRRDGPGGPRFEIAIAASILFDGFGEGDPEVTACGLPCANRLEAMQRMFEHEIVHLAEWICWGTTSCSRPRFQEMAARLFLHRAHTHSLITRAERAAGRGIRVGARVTFGFRGRRLAGRVNRITKRATVLVEDPRGEPYTDGGTYSRYYVPIGELRVAAESE